MRNLLITLRFDGSGYCGYQVQKNGPTVAASVQNAVEDLVGERIPITGCSRTDSGVHADMFCINFHTHCSIPVERVPSALNVRLPKDICRLSVPGNAAGFSRSIQLPWKTISLSNLYWTLPQSFL